MRITPFGGWGCRGGGLANRGHVYGLMSMVCPWLAVTVLTWMLWMSCSFCCVVPVVPCGSGKIVCFLFFSVFFLTAPCQKKKVPIIVPPTIMCAQEV